MPVSCSLFWCNVSGKSFSHFHCTQLVQTFPFLVIWCGFGWKINDHNFFCLGCLAECSFCQIQTCTVSSDCVVLAAFLQLFFLSQKNVECKWWPSGKDKTFATLTWASVCRDFPCFAKVKHLHVSSSFLPFAIARARVARRQALLVIRSVHFLQRRWKSSFLQRVHHHYAYRNSLYTHSFAFMYEIVIRVANISGQSATWYRQETVFYPFIYGQASHICELNALDC